MKVTIAPESMKEAEEDYILGRAEFGEMPFHVEAVRVLETDDGIQVATTEMNERRLDALHHAHGDGAFQTVEIPGHEGYWVLWITPYLT